MKRLLSLISLILIGVVCYASTPVQVLEINTAVHGVWKAYFIKHTGQQGQAINGQALCRVSSLSVITADGQTMQVERVLEFTENNIVYNSISFVGRNVFWIISKARPPYILLQVFSTITQKETMRVLAINVQ